MKKSHTPGILYTQADLARREDVTPPAMGDLLEKFGIVEAFRTPKGFKLYTEEAAASLAELRRERAAARLRARAA